MRSIHELVPALLYARRGGILPQVIRANLNAIRAIEPTQPVAERPATEILITTSVCA